MDEEYLIELVMKTIFILPPIEMVVFFYRIPITLLLSHYFSLNKTLIFKNKSVSSDTNVQTFFII